MTHTVALNSDLSRADWRFSGESILFPVEGDEIRYPSFRAAQLQSPGLGEVNSGLIRVPCLLLLNEGDVNSRIFS
jgi:hypothetical protein